MKRALVITNAYSSLASAAYQSARLKEEFSKLGVQTDVLKNGSRTLAVNGGVECGYGGYDFCVYLDKDKYAARMLESSGMRLFNRAAAIEVCDDKMLTHIALAGAVAMPETLPSTLCYTPDSVPDAAYLDGVEKRLGYPLVVKESYGSLGRGVYRADDRASLDALAGRLIGTPHLYQKFISESAGRDVRVIVIGGECVAAMERRSECDFRSNIELGGKGSPRPSDAEMRHICGVIAEKLNLDYCGVDLLEGKDGYLVCEVNSNAFFGGIEKATGVNVAREYARYILGNTTDNRKKI